MYSSMTMSRRSERGTNHTFDSYPIRIRFLLDGAYRMGRCGLRSANADSVTQAHTHAHVPPSLS